MAELRGKHWVELEGGYELHPTDDNGVRIQPDRDRDFVNGFIMDIPELRKGLDMVERLCRDG